MNRRNFFMNSIFGIGALSIPQILIAKESKQQIISDILYASIDKEIKFSPEFEKLNKDVLYHQPLQLERLNRHFLVKSYLDGKPLYGCQWINVETGEAQIITRFSRETTIVKGKLQGFIAHPLLKSLNPSAIKLWDKTFNNYNKIMIKN